MTHKVRAKMTCVSVHAFSSQESVEFNAVYSNDKSNENYTYSEATPSAVLKMQITNPSARGYFIPGREYVLTFEEATS